MWVVKNVKLIKFWLTKAKPSFGKFHLLTEWARSFKDLSASSWFTQLDAKSPAAQVDSTPQRLTGYWLAPLSKSRKAMGTNRRGKATFICGEQHAASHAQCQGKAWVSWVCKAISVTAKLQRTEQGWRRTKTLKGQSDFHCCIVLGGCSSRGAALILQLIVEYWVVLREGSMLKLCNHSPLWMCVYSFHLFSTWNGKLFSALYMQNQLT